MMSITRDHEICAGHRVVGQGGKCERLHGHAYKFEFTCEGEEGELDEVGRVLDFGSVKALLCNWVEENWDHRTLLWSEDPWLPQLTIQPFGVVVVPFNPTAENMARFLVEEIGPAVLRGTGVILTACVVHETSKCRARYEL